MTHFALHFAKYVGRLAGPELDSADLEKTLADSMIVALAASDVLNVNLDDALAKRPGKTPGRPSLPRDKTFQQAWALQLAVPTGRLGKALEALDHMEPLNVRGILLDSLLEIVEITLAAGEALGVNIENVLTARWKLIEGRRLL
jgi:hypothetical protein